MVAVAWVGHRELAAEEGFEHRSLLHLLGSSPSFRAAAIGPLRERLAGLG